MREPYDDYDSYEYELNKLSTELERQRYEDEQFEAMWEEKLFEQQDIR